MRPCSRRIIRVVLDSITHSARPGRAGLAPAEAHGARLSDGSGAAGGVENGEPDELVATVAQEDAFVGHFAHGGMLGLREADVKYVCFAIIVHRKMVGWKPDKVGNGLQN